MEKIFLAAVINFAAVIFCFVQPVFACSWDYTIWQTRGKNADALYRFIKDGKAGYIDQTGKIVIEPTLDFYGNYDGEFENGLLQIDDGKYINKTGKIAIDKDYYRSWDFSDGLAVAMQEDNGKWGYIDKTGKFVISPRFESFPNDYVYPFSDNLAMIEVKDKYGYINRTGEFVIKPNFLQGTEFKEGFARVVVEGPCLYVGDDPCVAFNARVVPEESKVENPELCKFTFIDKSGSIISTERFERAGEFSEGLAAVKLNGKWGYIDSKGRIAITPQFDKAEAFSEGLAVVTVGELDGFINREGKLLIPPKFKRATNFSDGLAAVAQNWNEKKFDYDDYFFIDKSGKQAFPETFALASHFFKGVAHVKLKTKQSQTEEYNYTYKGTFAYINPKGKKIFIYERKSEDD